MEQAIKLLYKKFEMTGPNIVLEDILFVRLVSHLKNARDDGVIEKYIETHKDMINFMLLLNCVEYNAKKKLSEPKKKSEVFLQFKNCNYRWQ